MVSDCLFIVYRTSFIELIEQVCDFSVRLLKTMIHQDVSSIEVRPEAEKAWADFCKRNIGTTPYVANCVSYYKVCCLG